MVLNILYNSLMLKDLTLNKKKTLMGLLHNKLVRNGFSGKTGIRVKWHTSRESMPKRDVSLEDLAASVLFGRIQGDAWEGKYQNEAKFQVVGNDLSGDTLKLIFLVNYNDINPRKWVFDLVTVFTIHDAEAGQPASAVFNLRFEAFQF